MTEEAVFAVEPAAMLADAPGYRIVVLSVDPILTSEERARAASVGLTLKRVGTAAQALALVQRQPTDLVLVNSAGAPNRGLDLCRDLRDASAIPLAYAGSGTLDDRLAALRFGCDGYLRRPFALDDLARLVRVLAPPPGAIGSVVVIAAGDREASAVVADLHGSRLRVMRCRRAEVAPAVVERWEPDVVVLAERAPELARVLRADPRFDAMLLVQLGGDHADGADDVLPPDFAPGELRTRLLARLRRAGRLRACAGRDAATGHYTRLAFERHLSEQLAVARRCAVPGTLALFALSERASDPRVPAVALRMLGRELEDSAALLGRFAHDTLAAYLPGMPSSAAVPVLDRAREVLGRMRLRVAGGTAPLRFHLGYAQHPPVAAELEPMLTAARDGLLRAFVPGE